MKVVHYLNQFFAGLGGEEAADHHPEYREGPVGPGVRLNELLGGAAQVVGLQVPICLLRVQLSMRVDTGWPAVRSALWR